MIKTLLLLCLLMILASDVLACSCWIKTTPADEYAENEEVFLAQISEIRPLVKNPTNNERVDFSIVLGVIKSYKGNPPAEVVAKANYFFHDPDADVHMHSCDPGLQEGELFIVFRKANEEPEIAACSSKVRRNSESLIQAIDDLATGASR